MILLDQSVASHPANTPKVWSQPPSHPTDLSFDMQQTDNRSIDARATITTARNPALAESSRPGAEDAAAARFVRWEGGRAGVVIATPVTHLPLYRRSTMNHLRWSNGRCEADQKVTALPITPSALQNCHCMAAQDRGTQTHGAIFPHEST